MRVARGSELTACWEQGRRLRTAHLDLAWRPSPAAFARTGVVVPRFHHSAVSRNRLRRRLREILRRHVQHGLPAVDLVVRAKHAAYAASFAALRAELADAASRLA
ncbi:MAG TPA: ribonuclease P protein component [Candidatus Dormibacteraeota bacterium]|nr:ribonuclease P protein component [Candidatus Dormibacteraeota bacterium]